MRLKQTLFKTIAAGRMTMIWSAITGGILCGVAMAQPPRYTVIDLGNLGPNGQPLVITNNGLVAGAAQTGSIVHAVLWYGSRMIDLGTPGLNSMALGVNNWGQTVGEAQTTTTDPNSEDFCGFAALGLASSGTTCVPALWQNGVMNALPTLGGSNGLAWQINNLSEAVGTAESAMPDSSCLSGELQKLQFEPVIWNKRIVHELPTYAGDPDGTAKAINDRGQAVGGSGVCGVNFFQGNLQPLHALLWEDGQVIDLGNLGGTGQGIGIMAENLNNRGQVIGYSDIQGNANFHAFLWTRESGMQDLGTIGTDVASLAIGINDAGQIVGVSLDANFNPRAFLRVQGSLIDLNTLVPAGTGLSLLTACSINAIGEIIGIAVDNSTGDVHGYLAVPKSHGQDEGGEQVWPGHGSSSPANESSQRVQFQRLAIGRR